MKLLLITDQPLMPYLERLIPHSPHTIETFTLTEEDARVPAQTRAVLAKATGFDAALLLPGAAAIPAKGLRAGGFPLVIPRVHNSVSLLLGAEAYRRQFARYDGKLCYSLPACTQEIFISPAAECQCLCYLADTTLGLHDTSLSARIIAQHHDWDYFHLESDPAPLVRLLAGDWQHPETLLLAPGARVVQTYRRDLLEQIPQPRCHAEQSAGSHP